MVRNSVIAEPHVHYGSGRAATRMFLAQRLTAVFNIVVLAFFVWFVARLAGSGPVEMVETVRNPLVAVMLVLTVVSVAVHMRIGVSEVIEDYIHEPRSNRLLLLMNTFYALAVALVATVAVAKIVIWG